LGECEFLWIRVLLRVFGHEANPPCT
jgi:hypothetical protein